MDFWNFIRNLFGGQDFKDKRFTDHQNNWVEDNFEDPVWQIDIDDNSRFFSRSFHIFSDPLQITRYFETQIENIFRNLIYEFNPEGTDTGTNVFPFAVPPEESLRDKMLKPSDDQTRIKSDTDLDGIVTAENFSRIWDEHNKPKLEMPYSRIIGKSIRKEYIRKPDGTIEQKQVVKDNEGNEETIISHQIGDKIHTIVTKKDKNGLETKIEEFSDIAECEQTKLPINKGNIFDSIDLNFFPWKNFFKPNPKL